MSAAEIELGLHPALGTVVDRIGVAGFEAGVASGLHAHVQRLGFALDPSARVVRGGDRAVAVRVDGTLLTYPPAFLLRLWFGIAPRHLRGAATGATLEGRYPDGWLIDCGRSVAESGDEEGCHAIGALIAQLVLDVVALHPASLLTVDDVARVYPAEARPDGVRDEDVLAVLRGVVELGVGLPSPDDLRDVIAGTIAVCPRVPDAIEEVFARLRARELDVEMDPGTFASLSDQPISGDRIAGDDPQITAAMREAIAVVYGHRLNELGLRLPVIFIRVDAFTRPEIRVRLNQRTSPPIPVPTVDEVAVAVTPLRLASLGIEAHPLIDAITGGESAAVAAVAQDSLRAAGIEPIPQYAYVAAAFARSAASMAYRMVSINEVEQDLATLELEHAPLVRAVLTRYSFAEITRILRALAREEVSIRDLRRILNVLLTFKDTTVPDIEAMFLDDPLPSPGEGPTMPAGAWVEPRLLAFVRRELGDRVCHDGGVAVDGGLSQVYPTSAELEHRLERATSATRADLDDAGTAIRDEIWRALGRSESGGLSAIVLTGARARLALRRVIEFELPGARVLARGELPAIVRVRVSRVTLSAPAEPSLGSASR